MTDRAEGIRCGYRLHDEGIDAVRACLEDVWGEAAARFRLVAEHRRRGPARNADGTARAELHGRVRAGARATEVEITFAATPDGTAVTIAHRGWERLGASGPERRERNHRGWDGLILHYERACATAGSAA